MSLVGLQTDPSGLGMGHKFAKSPVLVVVGIPPVVNPYPFEI